MLRNAGRSGGLRTGPVGSSAKNAPRDLLFPVALYLQLQNFYESTTKMVGQSIEFLEDYWDSQNGRELMTYANVLQQ